MDASKIHPPFRQRTRGVSAETLDVVMDEVTLVLVSVLVPVT